MSSCVNTESFSSPITGAGTLKFKGRLQQAERAKAPQSAVRSVSVGVDCVFFLSLFELSCFGGHGSMINVFSKSLAFKHRELPVSQRRMTWQIRISAPSLWHACVCTRRIKTTKATCDTSPTHHSIEKTWQRGRAEKLKHWAERR